MGRHGCLDNFLYQVCTSKGEAALLQFSCVCIICLSSVVSVVSSCCTCAKATAIGCHGTSSAMFAIMACQQWHDNSSHLHNAAAGTAKVQQTEASTGAGLAAEFHHERLQDLGRVHGRALRIWLTQKCGVLILTEMLHGSQ